MERQADHVIAQDTPHLQDSTLPDRRNVLTLGSLALLAPLLFSSCERESFQERVKRRPEVTTDDVLSDPQAWVGKEVRIRGDITYKEDRSGFINRERYRSGGLLGDDVRETSLYLRINHRYTVASSEESSLLPIVQSFDVAMDNQFIPIASAGDPTQLTAPYRLRENTVEVSGTIRLFSNVPEPYLDLDHSFYDPDR